MATQQPGVRGRAFREALRESLREQLVPGFCGLMLGFVHRVPTLAKQSGDLSNLEKILLVASVFVLGGLAAVVRRWRPDEHASLEIFFGIGLACSVVWYRMSADPLVNAMTLLGAAFILSRGLTNWVDWYEKTHPKQ